MIQDQFVFYNSRNFVTGISDLQADVFLDGSTTPVAIDLPLSELNATMCPGRYVLTLSAAQITSFGGAGTYLICINTAGVANSAPATARLEVLVNNNDDLSAQITLVSGAISSIQSDLTSVASDVSSVRTTVEDSNSVLNNVSSGNMALLAELQAVQTQISSIQNATRTVVAVSPDLIIPSTGSALYRVEISIFNVQGFLQDPDTNTVTLNIINAAGVDRGVFFQGNTGGGSVTATRVSIGNYFAVIEVSSSSAQERLTLSVRYTENDGDEMLSQRAIQTISEVQAAGGAQELTVQEILNDTSDIQPRVVNIEDALGDAGTGLASLSTRIDSLIALANSSISILNDSGFGLAAISNQVGLAATQVSVDNLSLDVDDVQLTVNDISSRIFSGGTAL